MRYLAIITFVALTLKLPAQQCGNCKLTPKLTTFDFDIQVPKPNVADSTDQLWPEWKNLFILAGSVATNLKKNSGNCITFTMPPSTDTGDVQLASVGGTFTNLPSNPNISSNLSDYGDYLLTGTIKKAGDACQLHVEVQSSCNRKVVASANVSFPLSSVAGNVNNIAQQAASQLSSLIDKIKKFELEERQKNKSLSLFKIEGEPMKLTPVKTTLKGGESTDFTIELKDCDNVPLQGREILFTETEFEGLKVYGTIGGTVTPAKVVTDANGKATARFTLKAGSKEAIINAHSPGNDVKGCSSMFTGDAAINIRRTYSGHVTFTYSSSGICNTESTSGCLKSTMISNHDMGITYKAAFYDDGSKQDKSVHFSGEEETSLVPRIMETGSYNARKFQVSVGEIVCESVSKGQRTVQKIQSVSEGKLRSGNFSFSFGDAGSGSVSVDMSFTANTTSSFEQTHLPSAKNSGVDRFDWQFSAIEGFDKNFTFKKETAGGKIKYTVSGTRTFTSGSACGGISTTETIKAVVYEE